LVVLIGFKEFEGVDEVESSVRRAPEPSFGWHGER